MTQLEPIYIEGITDTRPIIIAGPCSAETEEQVIDTARKLADAGVKIFRAGIWKPRTKPGGFEGIGAQGLSMAQKGQKGDRYAHRYRGRKPLARNRSPRCRYRYFMDRHTHFGQPFCNPGNSRCARSVWTRCANTGQKTR